MNNFEYAQKIEADLKQELLINAKTIHEKEYIEFLFENCIEIEPKQIFNNILDIDISSHSSENLKGESRKLSNIKLNLKTAIITAIETALVTEISTDEIGFIKLALYSLLKLYTLSRVKISNDECQILLFLHQKDAYNIPITEAEIFYEIDCGNIKVSKDNYINAINNLVKLSAVYITDAKIYLVERVKLKY